MSTKKLLEDLGKYKTVNEEFHAGDVLEHSVWSALYTNHFFVENNRVVSGIDPRMRNMLVVASLLHDIGKGGDKIYKFFDKENHPEIGGYYFEKGIYPDLDINLRTVVDELGESANYDLIKFLVRWHWMIGGVFREFSEIEEINNISWTLYYDFNLVCEKDDIPYKKRVDMFRYLWVIWEADLLATQPYRYEVDKGMPLEIRNYPATHKGRDIYKEFKIGEKFPVREFIIDVYNNGYKHPDFSQNIELFRNMIKLGGKYYRQNYKGNPFLWEEIELKESSLKPIQKDVYNMFVENKNNCLEFLKKNSVKNIPLFAGYPEIINGLSNEKLSEIYGIVCIKFDKYISSFLEISDEIFSEDDIYIVEKGTKLYHGRGYKYCEPPNIGKSRSLWVFEDKKYAYRYATGREPDKKYPAKDFCWNILEYETLSKCRLLNLTKSVVRDKIRKIIGEKSCESWFLITKLDDIEGNIKFSHILNYMFPDTEIQRQSHTTIDINVACALHKIFPHIDGWYIGKMGDFFPEIALFKPYETVKLISHEYFDENRMSGILQRCIRKGKERDICVNEIIKGFYEKEVVCLDYGNTKPIECYLLSEISDSEILSKSQYRKILSEIDRGNIIVTVPKISNESYIE